MDKRLLFRVSKNHISKKIVTEILKYYIPSPEKYLWNKTQSKEKNNQKKSQRNMNWLYRKLLLLTT